MPMIEPKYFTLNTLFADRVFRVPHYQRFYSWQTKQRDDLFKDLEDLHKKEQTGDRHHFMATIVCYRTGEKKAVKSVDYRIYEIVDGQQRITTLVLLFKALQKRLDDEEVKRDISRILVEDDDNLLLLQTNNVNEHLFNSYIRDGKAPQKSELKIYADWNLYSAIREIERFLDRWETNGDSLMDLLRLVRNRIGLVVYDTEESHAVYTIFECLNSRGLEVDWLDKTKSVLMGIAFEKSKSSHAANAKINELHNLWAGIYNAIALFPVPGHEILRVTSTLYFGAGLGKPLSAEDSIDELRKYCDSSQKTIEITKMLQAVAERLVTINTSRPLAAVTRILQVRVLGVALMLTEALDEGERQKALQQWERVSFRIFGLFWNDARVKVGDYIRLAAWIVQKGTTLSYEEIMDKLRVLGSEYPVDDAVDELLGRSAYEGYEEECRYILWRYEEYLAQQEGGEVNQELREKIWAARYASETIEHIFPQNPAPGGAWKGKLKKRARLDKHVNRIGNLLLLPPNLNSKAGNRSFAEKKRIYKKAEGLRIVMAVLRKKDWTQDAIDQRERHISAFLRESFADIIPSA